MKIIIRVPNWIGDAVLALPAIESIRDNFPQANISIAAKNWVKDLFASSGLAEEVISLPDTNDVKALWAMAQDLKARSFDLGLLLTNSFGSAFLFYLARIPKRWGYGTDGRSVLLTRSVALKESDAPRHQLFLYLDLLRGLGLKTVSPELKLCVSPSKSEAARARLISMGLDLSKPLVIICPGASYGPSKRWPPSHFARLASLLQERREVEILVIGSAEDSEVAATVASAMEKKPALLAGETTLDDLAGLISHASLFVSNDTGPMHMANALGVPVVAIFGPTDPAVTGPFKKPSVCLKKDVPCWPCSYRKCPYDHRCLMSIRPEEVFRVSQELWS
ncbi:MAG: lipopolysaccharide heptosyltransferase II [Clostridiales bacterium]|nr:lipopolysaccharide heptosyltransferase II [Clostridiales bacterium]